LVLSEDRLPACLLLAGTQHARTPWWPWCLLARHDGRAFWSNLPHPTPPPPLPPTTLSHDASSLHCRRPSAFSVL